MVFSSAVFLLAFLPIVFVCNSLIKKEYSNYLLLVSSLIFYAWGEPYLVLLMIASVIVNWAIGLLLTRTQNGAKKLVLAVGVACDLGILGYYKYAGFLAETLNSVCLLKRLCKPSARFWSRIV